MPGISALPERNALVYERSLDLNGLEAPGTAIASLVAFHRGPALWRETAAIGSAGAPGHATASNLDAIVLTSQATIQGVALTPITPALNVPLHRRPASFPAQYRTRRTYVFEVVCNMTTGPSATPAAVGIHATINDLNGSTDAGVEWFSGTAVNAGRWTARYRRTNAPTVIGNLADSGILPDATLHSLGLVYRESVPAVDWFLDGTLVFTQTDALSITDDATVTNKLPSIALAAGAAGTMLNIFGARFRVFDPDFPLYTADFSAQTPGPA